MGEVGELQAQVQVVGDELRLKDVRARTQPLVTAEGAVKGVCKPATRLIGQPHRRKPFADMLREVHPRREEGHNLAVAPDAREHVVVAKCASR